MSYPEPRPERLIMEAPGITCRHCRKVAEVHEFRGGREYHYCTEHAALYLWWYVDDYDRVAVGLPPVTNQRNPGVVNQTLTASEDATRTQLQQESDAAGTPRP